MRVLGIESTAHTFGVAVVQDRPFKILSDVRVKYRPKEGGIHPREAANFFLSRAHEAVAEAIRTAGVGVDDVDAVAVALGPGLGPCLRVGATVARFISSYYRKPLVPVNHAVAHIEIGRVLNKVRDPLVVYLSGGNTLIAAYVDGVYRVYGETLDIALGNFIDVFSREVGLAPPYVVNGRHVIEICAEKGGKLVELPYVVKGQDVSYSGLLTAALNMVKSGVKLEDVCYTVKEIAFSSIVEVAERALAYTGKKELLIVGGVAASKELRRKFELMAKPRNVRVEVVEPKYAVDNGVMIALTGLLEFRRGITVEPSKARINQRWRLDKVEVTWYEDISDLLGG